MLFIYRYITFRVSNFYEEYDNATDLVYQFSLPPLLTSFNMLALAVFINTYFGENKEQLGKELTIAIFGVNFVLNFIACWPLSKYRRIMERYSYDYPSKSYFLGIYVFCTILFFALSIVHRSQR